MEFEKHLHYESHGALDPDELIPLILVSKFSSSLPSLETVETLAQEFHLDSENFYWIPNAIFFSFCYYEPHVFVEFSSFTREEFQILSIKERVAQLRKQIQEKISKGEYLQAFSLIDKRIVFASYKQLFPQIPKERKYTVFRQIYVRSESGFDMYSPEFLKEIFSYRLFSEEWQKSMEKLKKSHSETLVAYHGTQEENIAKDELSWTLSLETAQFFAYRFKQSGKVLMGTIPIDKILDYLEKRGEEEILIESKYIKDIRCIEKKPC